MSVVIVKQSIAAQETDVHVHIPVSGANSFSECRFDVLQGLYGSISFYSVAEHIKPTF
jgi:hypothetical protein